MEEGGAKKRGGTTCLLVCLKSNGEDHTLRCAHQKEVGRSQLFPLVLKTHRKGLCPSVMYCYIMPLYLIMENIPWDSLLHRSTSWAKFQMPSLFSLRHCSSFPISTHYHDIIIRHCFPPLTLFHAALLS